MGTSVDFFPDGPLQLTARAQPVSGHPVRLEFTDDAGKHVADFTIFTRQPQIAVRLEHAINFVMKGTDQALTRDAIEELIGANDQIAFEAVVAERDQLYRHVEQLIGLVQMARAYAPPEDEKLITENPRFAEALTYMATIARPPMVNRTAPEVAEVLNATAPSSS